VNSQWTSNHGFCIALASMFLLAAATATAGTPPAGFVDASTFGYSTADATAALQAAINSGSNVFVPNMGTPWYVTPLWVTHDGQEILFESGTVVEAKPGAFTRFDDCLFNLEAPNGGGLNGVSLVGPGATLMMQQSDYVNAPYTHSEWRHAIWMAGVKNCTIDGLTIKNTGGDGIEMTAESHAIPYCENVTIKNVFIDHAYRNGISGVSVKNLLIDNAVILNTGGNPPQAGIDFEPDNNWESIQNVTVRNSIVASNTYPGIVFGLWATTDGPVGAATGAIENVTIVGNVGAGIREDKIEPGVTIKNVIVANNREYGYYSEITDAQGQASGQPRDTITYGDFSGNAPSSTSGWVALGAGCLTVAPVFYSTDPNGPYFMCLDPSFSPLITHGASDGGYMGARPVVTSILPGDADLNGTVNGTDLNTVLSNYNHSVASGLAGWQLGDFNGDGTVDGADLNVVLSDYNHSLSVAGAVPEPSTLLLSLASFVGLLAYYVRTSSQATNDKS
jgi:hypothetical protein